MMTQHNAVVAIYKSPMIIHQTNPEALEHHQPSPTGAEARLIGA